MALAALGVLVGGVGRVVLVDGVVGEVHEDVGERGVVRLVLVGGEPHEALVVDVDDERVDAGDEHVDAQVVLRVVDEVRPGYVPLHDHGSILWYLGPLVHHLDAVAARQLQRNYFVNFTSDKSINYQYLSIMSKYSKFINIVTENRYKTHRRRLDDPLCLHAPLLPHLAQDPGLRRHAKGPRQEAELRLAKLDPKLVVVLPQPIFSPDVERAGKVVDLLRLAEVLEEAALHVLSPLKFGWLIFET